MFTLGYWGWGSATDKLIEAVDTAEHSRGWEAPVFVDIRISRSVRAPGFRDNAFGDALGSSRYHWFPRLGNLGVLEGGSMRIKDPAAAVELLDLAEACQHVKRRVIFFCSCEYPGLEHTEGCCHRAVVAGLVLKAARERGRLLEIAEWPGGLPHRDLELWAGDGEYLRVQRGAATIPLDVGDGLADFAALPWFSTVAYNRGDAEADSGDNEWVELVVRPIKYKAGTWCLPIVEGIDPDMTESDIESRISELHNLGFQTRRSIDLPKVGIGTAHDVELSAPTAIDTRTEEAGMPSGSYTLADHPGLDGPMGPLFEELRKRVLAIAPEISMRIFKGYIAFVYAYHFVDILPRKKALKVRFCMPFSKIIDPQHVCNDITGTFGPFGAEFLLSSPSQLDYCLTLVRQAYEHEARG